MITEKNVWTDALANLDCPNIFFSDMIRTYTAFGHVEIRLTCSHNSLMHSSMIEELERGMIITINEHPFYPSYNDDLPTHSYDVKLTENGKIFMEYLML